MHHACHGMQSATTVRTVQLHALQGMPYRMHAECLHPIYTCIYMYMCMKVCMHGKLSRVHQSRCCVKAGWFSLLLE